VEGSDQTKTLVACCLLVGCPVRTNNVLTQTLLVRIEQPTSKQQATNVPKTEKHNRSKFGVPMPLENILKCRSTVTLLERDDQTTPQICPYSPYYEALSSHVEPYPERAAVFLTRLANDDKEQTWSKHGPKLEIETFGGYRFYSK